jgi:glycosyltransferase involved in cell wall biosynthesis
MVSPKVVYWSQNHVFGSAERYIFDLAENMGAHSFDVHLVCSADPALEPYRPLEQHGVTIHWVDDVHYQRNALLALPFWIRFFRELKPDVVHFNDPCLVGGVAAQLARVPKRVMMHHTPAMNRNYNFNGRVWEWLAFRSYTNVIFSNAISRETASHKDRLPIEKGVVIPFGIHPDWFTPIEEDTIQQIRSELDVGADEVVILCPGRLAKQKRHDILIQVAEQVLERADEAVFLFAGDGELRDEIATQIQEAGLTQKVRLLGFRSDIRDLMTVADIVVLSSDYEGFPYVLMESAARGTPVVCTEVGGVRHAVKDGETGILVPPRDPSALAQALLELTGNLEKRQQFSKADCEHAEAAFTTKKVVENTAAFYHRVLARPREISS